MSSPPWKAALVDGFTQSSKTWKCFEFLHSKIRKDNGVLVIFVTQANCTASVNQTIQRARSNSLMTHVIPTKHIFKSTMTQTELQAIDFTKSNYMIVDFWHKRNKKNMTSIVKQHTMHLREVIVVIDEIEQGAKKGVFTRLEFIREIESLLLQPQHMRIVFITATVPNLSKSIAKIATNIPDVFNKSIVLDILYNHVIEHHFVTPHKSYVGPSWFQTALTSNGQHVWRRLSIAKKSPEEKANIIHQALKTLPYNAKELCLIVTSTKVDEHKKLATSLFDVGFNVVVELNSHNDRNFMVNFQASSNQEIQSWQIPYSIIATKANKGMLATTYVADVEYETQITHHDHITLAHMLQASLFMRTHAHERIKNNISQEEFIKLSAIFSTICHLDSEKRRPREYPQEPRVALVAGHLAGRGITIQNPFVDFICTSLCFTDVIDNAQRGANNSQRFGRACGMLKEIYAADSSRIPLLIATEAIMRDAVANEKALAEKAKEINNGELVSLRTFITDKDWQTIMKKTKDNLATVSTHVDKNLTYTQTLLLIYYKLSNNGTTQFTQHTINKNPQAKEILDKNNRRPHKELVDNKYILKIAQTYEFTDRGREYAISYMRLGNGRPNL